MMDWLSVSGIKKKHGENLVLNEVSFTQQRFRRVAIAGETGSGKSTLLKIVAGLIQADAGQVLFEGQRVLGPDEKLLPGHSAIAYLSQHFELRNNYRVEELLDMANKVSAFQAETIFKVCRIVHLLKRRTNQVSGGEKQRIALARLLVSSPTLLLLDEPFSNLDIVHKSILKSVIEEVSEKLRITCILISHDPLDILSWADDIIVMKDGQLIKQGPPEKIYNEQQDEYTAGLFGRYNVLKGDELALFGLFEGGHKNNLIVRPERFELSKEKTEGAQAGKVKQVYFFGGHDEVEVVLAGKTIIVRTNCAVKRDDTVYVWLQKV